MGHLDDPNDEVRTHAGKSGDEADQAIIRRLRRWIDKQPPETQQYFCVHGSYVGYQNALAYKCRLCAIVEE